MNYMEINFDFVSITPYSIPDCSVLLSTGLHTDREAGDVEVGLIEIIGPPTLNSAVGGFIPHFVPSPSLQHIVAAVQLSITDVFGSGSALDIQTDINRFLDNQKKFLEGNVTGTTTHKRQKLECNSVRAEMLFRMCIMTGSVGRKATPSVPKHAKHHIQQALNWSLFFKPITNMSNSTEIQQEQLNGKCRESHCYHKGKCGDWQVPCCSPEQAWGLSQLVVLFLVFVYWTPSVLKTIKPSVGQRWLEGFGMRQQARPSKASLPSSPLSSFLR
ncbi:hypothetical protein R3P38DRAFT_2760471 [Favolaschia claudopus]|uniref:Uncharacterized protein n=1 Tax=Favolaschia claudopus TaxID=2862362 RepID=A0AAW0DTL0_9AGAR